MFSPRTKQTVCNNEVSVKRGLLILNHFLKVGALTIYMKNGVINPWDGELTFIGKVLGELPVDVHLGKLLVLGYVFGCLEECLVISKCYLKPLYP